MLRVSAQPVCHNQPVAPSHCTHLTDDWLISISQSEQDERCAAATAAFQWCPSPTSTFCGNEWCICAEQQAFFKHKNMACHPTRIKQCLLKRTVIGGVPKVAEVNVGHAMVALWTKQQVYYAHLGSFTVALDAPPPTEVPCMRTLLCMI